MNEWPNTLYRYDAETGAREGQTFRSPEDVPVEKGWVKFEDLGPAPVIVEKPKAKEKAAELPKLYRELQAENARLADTVKLLTDELAALRAQMIASGKPPESAPGADLVSDPVPALNPEPASTPHSKKRGKA